MRVSIDLCVVPLGVGVSVSDYVAVCVKVFEDAKLTFQLHANGTDIEGEWDQVFAASSAVMKSCMLWALRA